MFDERVRSVMRRRNILKAPPKTLVKEAAKLMANKNVGAIMLAARSSRSARLPPKADTGRQCPGQDSSVLEPTTFARLGYRTRYGCPGSLAFVGAKHANFHVLNANSAMLARCGIRRDGEVDGIVRDTNGEPTGELSEMAAMFPVFRVIGDPFAKGRGERAAWNFARLALSAGVTTAIDITNDLTDASVDPLRKVCDREDFPLRLVAALFGNNLDPRDGIERVRAREACNSDRLRFGSVKLMPCEGRCGPRR